MRVIFASLLLVFSFVVVNGQDRIAKGYILDKDSRAALDSSRISVVDTPIYVYTDDGGSFSIVVPKKRRFLMVYKENYDSLKISLKPGFQHRPLRLYLESKTAVNQYAKKRLERDSAYLTYKNSLSLSLIEFFAVAIAFRYEYFITPKHSLGLHTSFYIYGRNPMTLGSEHDYYPAYHGFKLATAYRFYPYRKKGRALFLEAKLPIGYIHFSKLDYHSSNYGNHLDVNIKYSLWIYGYSFSAGTSFSFPKTKHAVMTISVGYQYFPLNIPKTVNNNLENGVVLTLPHATYWWYQGGPGSKFEMKFMIGGIF